MFPEDFSCVWTKFRNQTKYVAGEKRMIDIDSQKIRENITAFDEAHIVKQIILIGSDGVTRNIELELIEDDEEWKHIWLCMNFWIE